MNRFVIYGAGGHAKVVADAIESAGGVVVCFVDDEPTLSGKSIWEIAIREPAWLIGSDPASVYVALGVGDNAARERVATRCIQAGFRLPPIIHRSSTVAKSTLVGSGVFIGPHAIVNADAKLANGVIVNTGAIVEHDVSVGAYAHVCPSACLAGGAKLGTLSVLGAGATVIDDVFVGDGTTIGAGSVVTRHIPDNVVAFGAPARVRRQLTKETTQ